jgi:hypothetical protein
MALLLLNNKEIGFKRNKCLGLEDINQLNQHNLKLKNIKSDHVSPVNVNKILIPLIDNKNKLQGLANIMYWKKEISIMVGSHHLKLN